MVVIGPDLLGAGGFRVYSDFDSIRGQDGVVGPPEPAEESPGAHPYGRWNFDLPGPDDYTSGGLASHEVSLDDGFSDGSGLDRLLG